LINHSSDVIKEHITWAIGNIAGDNIVYRDYFLERDVVSKILSNLKPVNDMIISKGVLDVSIFALSNLVRGKTLS